VVAAIVLLVLVYQQQQEYRAQAEGAASRMQEQLEATHAEQAAAEEAARVEQRQLLADRVEQTQAVFQNDDVIVLVLGDSTGNDSNEWVSLWAQDLADQGRTIDYYLWDSIEGVWPDEPSIFGQGQRSVAFWNGSHPGATVEFPLGEEFEMPDISPDLVITSFGHNGEVNLNRSGNQQLWSALHADFDASVVAIAQNPALGDRESTSSNNKRVVLDVASERSIPVIDVHSAFMEVDNPSDLLLDDVHPNGYGARLWADTVAEYF